MAQCDYCGSRIIFGGLRDGDLRFCNRQCHQNGMLVSLVRQVPVRAIEKHVQDVHQGPCPICHGPGPVDAHTSYRVWSALLLTRWGSRIRVSCRGCGAKRQAADALFSLVFGWWGIPWGLIWTPVQLVRNVVALCRPPDRTKPSALLQRLVSLNLAAHLRQPAPEEKAAA